MAALWGTGNPLVPPNGRRPLAIPLPLYLCYAEYNTVSVQPSLKVVHTTGQEEKQLDSILSSEVDEARRLALRENAKRVLQESGLAEMLKTLNKNALKGRGNFHEFDSMLLLKWGTSQTRRHIWIEINGNTIRFRLSPHRQCSTTAPICDGEYHTFTSGMWSNREFLLSELNKYYAKPVAETSSD